MPCDLQRMQTANLAHVTTFIVLNILYNYTDAAALVQELFSSSNLQCTEVSLMPVDLALVQGLVIAGSAIAD